MSQTTDVKNLKAEIEAIKQLVQDLQFRIEKIEAGGKLRSGAHRWIPVLEQRISGIELNGVCVIPIEDAGDAVPLQQAAVKWANARSMKFKTMVAGTNVVISRIK